jgi:hypothetical protein
MIGDEFVKRKMEEGAGLFRGTAMKENPIDAPRAWCKSQMLSFYSALVRLNNGPHAQRIIGP